MVLMGSLLHSITAMQGCTAQIIVANSSDLALKVTWTFASLQASCRLVLRSLLVVLEAGARSAMHLSRAKHQTALGGL